jgi:hypothetical protein
MSSVLVEHADVQGVHEHQDPAPAVAATEADVVELAVVAERDRATGMHAVVTHPERSFDAPVDLIWQMWTDPEHFKAWYGPNGAAIPVARMDVRVGGTRFVCTEMQSPNGPMRMWFTGEYREVVENE